MSITIWCRADFELLFVVWHVDGGPFDAVADGCLQIQLVSHFLYSRKSYKTFAKLSVPYDQWLVTHVDPAWKVKQVKLWILSKCLTSVAPSPYGNNNDQEGLVGDEEMPPVPRYRPASPITFAPDPRDRPISPIMFAVPGVPRPVPTGGVSEAGSSTGHQEDDQQILNDGEDDGHGYEEDDEWDSDDGTEGGHGGRVSAAGTHHYRKRYAPDLNASISSSSAISHTSNPVDQPRRARGLGDYPQFYRGYTASSNSHVVPSRSHSPSIPPIITMSTAAGPGHPHGFAHVAGAYTLLRFSTGQILEDDFQMSWYDISPYELIELHGGDTVLSKDKGRRESHHHPPHHHHNGQSRHHKDKDRHGATSSMTIDIALPPLRIVRFNRKDISAYITPYWEGWVRALRVVWREEHHSHHLDPYLGGYGKPSGHSGGLVYKQGGMGLGIEYIDAEQIRQRERKERERKAREREKKELRVGTRSLGDVTSSMTGNKDGGGHGQKDNPSSGTGRRTKLEWRDRWVVIKDGMLTLCKDRDVSLNFPPQLLISGFYSHK